MRCAEKFLYQHRYLVFGANFEVSGMPHSEYVFKMRQHLFWNDPMNPVCTIEMGSIRVDLSDTLAKNKNIVTGFEVRAAFKTSLDSFSELKIKKYFLEYFDTINIIVFKVNAFSG